jgi:uncharacterized membrane protein YeiH
VTPPEVINDLAHTVTDEDWRMTRAVIETTAVASGALMGSLHAIKRDFDLVGVTVVALCAGFGGGVLRDVLINRPVLALQREELMIAALSACAVGMVLGHRTHRLTPIIWVVEAISLGLFTVTGIQRAEEVGLTMLPAVFLGVVTGTCGGLLRDIICNETPILVLPGRPLALASFIGGLTYYGFLHWLDFPRVVCEWTTALTTFTIRALSSWRDWKVRRPHEVFRLPPSVRKQLDQRLRGLGRKREP